jgi:hypothetical protein
MGLRTLDCLKKSNSQEIDRGLWRKLICRESRSDTLGDETDLLPHGLRGAEVAILLPHGLRARIAKAITSAKGNSS